MSFMRRMNTGVSDQALPGMAAIIIAQAAAHYFFKRGICGDGEKGK